MVLESVIDGWTAEKRPADALILGFVLSTVAMLLALIIYSPYNTANLILGIYTICFLVCVGLLSEYEYSKKIDALVLVVMGGLTYAFMSYFNSITYLDFSAYKTQISLSIVFLTALGLSPLIFRLLAIEEKKDVEDLEDNFIERHYAVIEVYSMLFVGMILSFALWFTIMPEVFVNTIFSEQLKTIQAIEHIQATMLVVVTGMAINKTALKLILFNNVKVLLVITLLSFALGTGAIFILTWNASVIGAVIGDFARSMISQYAGMGNLAGVSAYFVAVPISFGKLIFHGLPEMLAYFIASIAGGILSVAMTHHERGAIKYVVTDAMKLLGIAILLLVIGACIEAWIIG